MKICLLRIIQFENEVDTEVKDSFKIHLSIADFTLLSVRHIEIRTTSLQNVPIMCDGNLIKKCKPDKKKLII